MRPSSETVGCWIVTALLAFFLRLLPDTAFFNGHLVQSLLFWWEAWRRFHHQRWPRAKARSTILSWGQWLASTWYKCWSGVIVLPLSCNLLSMYRQCWIISRKVNSKIGKNEENKDILPYTTLTFLKVSGKEKSLYVSSDYSASSQPSNFSTSRPMAIEAKSVHEWAEKWKIYSNAAD